MLSRSTGRVKTARYGADETCMVTLDARTIRMAVLLGVLIVVIFLGTVAPRQAGYIVGSAVGISLLVVCWLKGKPGSLFLGFFAPFVWLIAAIRLAKPTSYWATRWYDAPRMAQAEQRFARSKRALADPS
jgi:energy-coupling factor transporter transmembrane protein EcfT